MAAMASAALGIVAAWQGQLGVAVFCFALSGACVGFLYFNFYPARVFMGDTGSLAIGAGLAAASGDDPSGGLADCFWLALLPRRAIGYLQVISFSSPASASSG